MKSPGSLLAPLSLAIGLVLPASGHAQGDPIRILPMGDSITFGTGGTAGLGGYRGPLYDLLVNAGYEVDYVGTSTGNSEGLVEKEHEGHGGWRIDQLDANVAGWFNAIEDPDIILLHIGTNDFGQGNDTVNAINRIDALITKMAGLRPNAHIVVTNIMERGEPQNSQIQAQFNPFIEGVVEDQMDAGNLVSFLDMRSAVPLSDMPDNLHPNQTGYGKMAAAWFGAIEGIVEPDDDVPPAIVRARGTVGRDSVIVTFNRDLEPTSAETVGNYAISGGIDVLTAALSANGRTVTLGTTLQSLGTSYTLTVNNVQDLVEPTPNTIAQDSTVDFFPATPRGYANNVPESECYTLVYSLEIPDSPDYQSLPVSYDIDHQNRVGSFDRIAYYLELQTPGGDGHPSMRSRRTSRRSGFRHWLPGRSSKSPSAISTSSPTSPASPPARASSATSSSGRRTTSQPTQRASPARATRFSTSATTNRPATTDRCSCTTRRRGKRFSLSTAGEVRAARPISGPAAVRPASPIGRSPRTPPAMRSRPCRCSCRPSVI